VKDYTILTFVKLYHNPGALPIGIPIKYFPPPYYIFDFTAGILQPLLAVLGITTPALTAVTVMAIAAGAMTVSHANDSYFWVVTEFGGIETKDGYKTQTLMTLVIGLASMIGIVALYYVLK